MAAVPDPRTTGRLTIGQVLDLLRADFASITIPKIRFLEEKGLDCVLIGPHDLSTSLGVPEQYDHPRFLEACSFILGKARAAGIGAGIHHWLSPEKQIQFVEMGANLLIHKADAIFLSEGLQSQLGEIRSLLGQEGGPGGGSQVTI